MKKFIEKVIHTVIPHEKNSNIPHILKEEFVFILIVFVGVLFYFNQNNFNIIKSLNLTATVYPSVLADLANKDRAISSTPPLAWSETLANAAKLKAQDMIANEYFAHTSPAGISPWYWLDEVDYNFKYAGENLAMDFTESVNVEKAWINSPKHKENILNSNFTEIGIATVDGVFKGKNTTFVVEFFGNPITKKITENNIVNNKMAPDDISNVTTSTVAGVSTKSVLGAEIKILEENKDFIVVKNDKVLDDEVLIDSNNTETHQLSTWYNRFFVSPTKAIKIIYITMFFLVLLSILLVLSKEYRKHHTKHLVMGTILMTVITIMFYFVSIGNI